MTKDHELLVYAHVHWDREWGYAEEEYRLILEDVAGEVLNLLENEPDYPCFHFDGQTKWLEDYLGVFPENEGRIKKLVKEKKLFIGPWYVQPDEILVDGESIIRNLLIGHKLAGKFGGVMKVGYVIDMRGHNSQMPQIFQGFEIENAVLGIGARGYSGLQTEFLWKAPDGSDVLTCDLYCYATRLMPEDLKEAAKFIATYKEFKAKHTNSRYIVFPLGADTRKPRIGDMRTLKKIAALDKSIIRPMPLEDIFRLFRKENRRFKAHQGELIKAMDDVLILDRLAARIRIKQENRRTQDLLVRWTEPFSVFNGKSGHPYPVNFIERAWKILVTNQFHDAIYGNHSDKVYHDVMQRFKKAQEIGNWLANKALCQIAADINIDQEDKALIVFNPLNWEQSRVINLKLYFAQGSVKAFEIFDQDKNRISYEINSVKVRKGFVPVQEYVLNKYPANWGAIGNPGKTVEEVDVTLLAESVPPCGYRTYYVKPLYIPRYRNCEHVTPLSQEAEGSYMPAKIRADATSAENEFVKMVINPNGSINVFDKKTGVTCNNLNMFEDGGDKGTNSNYSPPIEDEIFSTAGCQARISLLKAGPIQSVHRIEYDFDLPDSIGPDDRSRSKEKVRCAIASYIKVSAHSKSVDVETKINNTARDHRLRVVFPSGIKVKYVDADSQFDVVRRNLDELTCVKGFLGGYWGESKEQYWSETPTKIRPQQRFVDVTDGRRGMAVINLGLPEYEVTPDGRIYLTLLRSVGAHGKDELPEVPNRTGQIYDCPLMQLQGEHVFNYAIVPHKGTWREGKIHLIAMEHNIPMKGFEAEKHKGPLPDVKSFLSLKPDDLILSAVKMAEVGKGIIVRFYNISSRTVKGVLQLDGRIKTAQMANMLEEPIKGHSLTMVGRNKLTMKVLPKKIVTVLIELDTK